MHGLDGREELHLFAFSSLYTDHGHGGSQKHWLVCRSIARNLDTLIKIKWQFNITSLPYVHVWEVGGTQKKPTYKQEMPSNSTQTQWRCEVVNLPAVLCVLIFKIASFS